MPKSTRVSFGRRSRPTGGGVLLFLTDFLLIFLTLFGALCCFLTSFSMQTLLYQPLLPVGCAVLAFLSCICWSLPQLRFTALALLGMGLIRVFLSFRNLILAGGELVLAQVRNLMSTKLDGIAFFEPPSYNPPYAQVCFLLLLLTVFALLLGFAVVRTRSGILVVLCSLPLALPGLVAELWPWWPGFAVLIACWLSMLLTALSRRSAPRETARLTLLILPATIALTAALSFAIPPEDYTQPSWTLDAYGKLVDLGERITRKDGGGIAGLLGGVSAGSSETVDLANAGPQRYRGTAMLQVTSEIDERLYLRGCSAGVYTGTQWKQLSDEQYGTMPAFLALQSAGQPLYFPSLACFTPWSDGYGAQMVTVRNLRAPSRYVYAPYGLDPSAPVEKAQFVRDVGLQTESSERVHDFAYSGDARNLNVFTPLTGAAARAETAYRAFVYQNYLDVPEGFADTITLWFTQASKGIAFYNTEGIPEQFSTAINTANLWASMLAATTQYSLDAPAPPEGRDFVEYFLNESHVGYCMHYATAATLLLRTSGIPARYVSGFLVDAHAGKTNVPDSSAHAWTEIYLDGYGWYPIDATPAAGQDSTAQPRTSSTPNANPADPKPEAPTPPKPDAPKPEAPAAAKPTPTEKSTLSGWLVLPLALALLVVTLVLRRHAARASRRNRMNPQSPNAAVIAAYVWLKKLKAYGAQAPDTVERLARKAKFSQHTLTAQECESVLRAVHDEAARVDKAASVPVRLLLHYVRALY